MIASRRRLRDQGPGAGCGWPRTVTVTLAPSVKLSRHRRVVKAVIVEPAHPSRIYPLLMSAYGLTEREKT